MSVHKINNLLDELDDRYAVPFLMRHLGHEDKEIAKHLGLPVSTVKIRLNNARKLLKEMITAKNQREIV